MISGTDVLSTAFCCKGVKLSYQTEGQIRIGDALPDLEERADEIVAEYTVWYESLTPLQQKAVDKTSVPEIINRIDEADGDAIVRYGMDKQVKKKWNGVVGFQFQLNKRWMFRTEGGIIGDRKSILGSVNYRFLI